MKTNKCPWCGEEQNYLCDLELFEDGKTLMTECEHCCKQINVTCSVSVDYDIKAFGCEHHKLDAGPHWSGQSNFIHLQCVECREEFYNHTLKYCKVSYELIGTAKLWIDKRKSIASDDGPFYSEEQT